MYIRKRLFGGLGHETLAQQQDKQRLYKLMQDGPAKLKNWEKLAKDGDKDLAGAYLEGSENLVNLPLLGVNLTGANATKADFYKSNLTGANLTKAILKGALFIRSTLAKVNITVRISLKHLVLHMTLFVLICSIYSKTN